ncbi:DUF6252 family protein [uncultured Formosa sp.]|uniref:DUF6252 family protein n=1 Tax=uncultured Formosa sp. TaxID=255435 RepID=UPI002627ED4E|nr:DUF6252 family protein [uncultured Formosa sp.]
MKTWYAVFLVCLMFTGCGDDLEFNDPSLQANKDGELWKTTTHQVFYTSGAVILSGNLNGAVISLEIPALEIGTYYVGKARDEMVNAKAVFTNATGVEFSTLYSADDSLTTPNIDESTVYYSEGEIQIEEINTTEGYISGVFWFTAYNELGTEKVDFNQGVFYRVPIIAE